VYAKHGYNLRVGVEELSDFSATRKPITAQGMEARQGGDEGTVHDSPVGSADAPEASQGTPA
jgi:hypothetical protein